MQIVIDIPEGRYEELMTDDIHLDVPIFKEDIVATLPKNHGRLKDVDWIDDNCENHYSDKDGSWCYTWRDIEDAPTIIEADKGESEDK